MNISLLLIGVVLFTFGIQDAIGLVTDERDASIFAFMQLGEKSSYLHLDVFLIVVGAILARHSAEAEKKIKRFLKRVYPSGK